MRTAETSSATASARAQRSQESTLPGNVAKVALVPGEAAAGIFGHSYALIAEAIESGTDVLSAGIGWLGRRTAAREPDANHPYGPGKAEPLAAVVAAKPAIHDVLVPIELTAAD